MKGILREGVGVLLSGLAAVLAGVALVVVLIKTNPPVQPDYIVQESEVTQEEEHVAEPAVEDDEPELTGEVISKNNDIKMYSNALLGLSFEFPSDYQIREDISLAAGREPVDYIQGDVVSVLVVDEDEEIVFQIRAVSDDFGRDSEGCCYFVREPIDINQTSEQLTVALDKQLNSVEDVEKVTIGGESSVAFYYTTRYVETAFFRGAVTPVTDGEFANIFFTSAYLGKSSSDMDPAPPIVNVDTRLVAEYEEILTTVKWLNE